MESDYDYWCYMASDKLNTLKIAGYYMLIEHLIAY